MKAEWVGFSSLLYHLGQHTVRCFLLLLNKSCPILLQLHWLSPLQIPLSVRFPRQEYWSGLPFPTPGDLSQPRDPTHVPCIAGGFFTIEPQGSPSPQLIFVGLINVWLGKWVYSEKEGTRASGCGNVADKGQRQEHMVWWQRMPKTLYYSQNELTQYCLVWFLPSVVLFDPVQ